MLIRQLLAKHEDIHVLNRAQIIDDVFHLAEDGVLSYSLPFPLVNYLIDQIYKKFLINKGVYIYVIPLFLKKLYSLKSKLCKQFALLVPTYRVET